MIQERTSFFFMEYALEMVIAFNSDGKITYANAKAKELLEYDTLCGEAIGDIFPNSFGSEAYGTEADFGFGIRLHDMMAYRKNRTCFPVKARIIRDEENTGNYVCMAQDQTQSIFLEKKIEQIEKEAKDALKVKSEFVANVTHELRTPVNGFSGNTRELVSMEDDPKKLAILRMLERGCNDMNSIINNILDFSKLEAGKFTLEIREFNFRDMIDYVKSNHMHKITEKGLDFFLTISPDVPEYIIGDELRIVQILNNLLSNACKFTSVGKIVLEVVKTTQVKNKIELFFLVIDTGIGISKDDQDKLFKSFSQVDASVTRRYGGTGLGLNICKQLVELMDGSIRVESTANQGSMFSFSVWVEIPKGKEEQSVQTESYSVPVSMKEFRQETKSLMKFGESENLEALRKQMSKMILSIEMDNWEKGETFSEAIKQLTDDAPKDVKMAALKLKMAVQKGDYDKTVAAYEVLQKLVDEQ